MRILGISGSLRAASTNSTLLKAAAAMKKIFLQHAQRSLIGGLSGDGADEGVGERKCAVEENRGAAGHGHRRAEGYKPKKLVSPAGKRRAVHHLCDERSYAERNACRLVKQPRSTQRYRARIDYQERRIRKR